MARVADSSALYAFFSSEDGYHARARKELGSPEPVLVPSEILVETVDLLERRFGRASARAALNYLLQLPHLSIAEQVHIEAVRKIYEEMRGGLSLADAFVIQTCIVTGASPFTFDRAIQRAVGR